MTLKPQLTMVRSKHVGSEFYDAVIAPARTVAIDSSAVLFHFSGSYRDEFFVVTAYRDNAAALKTFEEITGAEYAAGVIEAGSPPDLSRQEFEIVSYAVSPDDQFSGFRFAKPGEFIAVLVSDPEVSSDRYLATRAGMKFPEEWPDGMVFHVASMFGKYVGVFDVWRADADLGAFYGARLTSSMAEVSPELLDSVDSNPNTIEVHSLYLNSSTFEESREYLRRD